MALLRPKKWHFHARFDDGSSEATIQPAQRQSVLKWLNESLRKKGCVEVRMIREDQMTTGEHERAARGERR